MGETRPGWPQEPRHDLQNRIRHRRVASGLDVTFRRA
jgi:hypothetical protein